MANHPVKCSQCGKGFASVMKLMQHFTKVHATKKEKS